MRLFLCDVDGILTDGGIYVSSEGVETKRFYIPDGLGLKMLQKCGIPVGWISNRPSGATQKRAEELAVDYLYQTKESKVAAAEEILKKAGLGWEQTCYLGDDIVDLGLLSRAGLAVTVPQALLEAKKTAHHVTRARAGHGAVREVVEMILKAQKKWPAVVAAFKARG